MPQEKTILVVDDLDICRTGTTFLVKGMGYNTEQAESGAEALEKFQAVKCSLILMDCNMPLMDGFECAAKIRELELSTENRIPIVGFSASLESDLIERCLNSGMDACLPKSCSEVELSRTLQSFLFSKSSERSR